MCKQCSDAKTTRRDLLKQAATGLAAVFVTGLAAQSEATEAAGVSRPLPGYGRCLRCSCPGFSGQGQVCRRCGHHWSEHMY